MTDPFVLIAELGLPIASGLTMGYFIFLVMGQLMNGLVSEIKTIQGISKMLITRASIMNNDMIRIDTSVSSALNISPDLHRIARAENFVEDGKIDARRD
ncbi:MAG TPA: hypothetical protein DEO86_09260 [Colwellia sp.]|nr:hypothetical protein [Colwellia sp.]|tara:strand:+ start:1242 stop:1538 length:297 start_codon:yes stop_codon:yes gene_type:complete